MGCANSKLGVQRERAGAARHQSTGKVGASTQDPTNCSSPTTARYATSDSAASTAVSTVDTAASTTGLSRAPQSREPQQLDQPSTPTQQQQQQVHQRHPSPQHRGHLGGSGGGGGASAALLAAASSASSVGSQHPHHQHYHDQSTDRSAAGSTVTSAASSLSSRHHARKGSSAGNNSNHNLNNPQSVRKYVRWRKGNRIGNGALGPVFLGLNSESGEVMAVMEIDVGSWTVSQAAARQRQVAELSAMQHENIVCYLGSEICGSALFVFMEWFPGGTLQDLLAKFGRFTEKVCKMYVRQLLRGLAYLHAHGVPHTDVTLGNLYLDDKGHIRIADFGVSPPSSWLLGAAPAAAAAASSSYLVATGDGGQDKQPDYTFYTAPEVARASAPPSARSDTWRVGCILQHMVTGTPPWLAAGPSAPASSSASATGNPAGWETASPASAAGSQAPGSASSNGSPVPTTKETMLARIAHTTAAPPFVTRSDVSDELRSFLVQCFAVAPEHRPDPAALLRHPWLSSQQQHPDQGSSRHGGGGSFPGSPDTAMMPQAYSARSVATPMLYAMSAATRAMGEAAMSGYATPGQRQQQFQSRAGGNNTIISDSDSSNNAPLSIHQEGSWAYPFNPHSRSGGGSVEGGGQGLTIRVNRHQYPGHAPHQQQRPLPLQSQSQLRSGQPAGLARGVASPPSLHGQPRLAGLPPLFPGSSASLRETSPAPSLRAIRVPGTGSPPSLTGTARTQQRTEGMSPSGVAQVEDRRPLQWHLQQWQRRQQLQQLSDVSNQTLGPFPSSAAAFFSGSPVPSAPPSSMPEQSEGGGTPGRSLVASESPGGGGGGRPALAAHGSVATLNELSISGVDLSARGGDSCHSTPREAGSEGSQDGSTSALDGSAAGGDGSGGGGGGGGGSNNGLSGDNSGGSGSRSGGGNGYSLSEGSGDHSGSNTKSTGSDSSTSPSSTEKGEGAAPRPSGGTAPDAPRAVGSLALPRIAHATGEDGGVGRHARDVSALASRPPLGEAPSSHAPHGGTQRHAGRKAGAITKAGWEGTPRQGQKGGAGLHPSDRPRLHEEQAPAQASSTSSSWGTHQRKSTLSSNWTNSSSSTAHANTRTGGGSGGERKGPSHDGAAGGEAPPTGMSGGRAAGRAENRYEEGWWLAQPHLKAPLPPPPRGELVISPPKRRERRSDVFAWASSGNSGEQAPQQARSAGASPRAPSVYQLPLLMRPTARSNQGGGTPLEAQEASGEAASPSPAAYTSPSGVGEVLGDVRGPPAPSTTASPAAAASALAGSLPPLATTDTPLVASRFLSMALSPPHRVPRDDQLLSRVSRISSLASTSPVHTPTVMAFLAADNASRSSSSRGKGMSARHTLGGPPPAESPSTTTQTPRRRLLLPPLHSSGASGGAPASSSAHVPAPPLSHLSVVTDPAALVGEASGGDGAEPAAAHSASLQHHKPSSSGTHRSGISINLDCVPPVVVGGGGGGVGTMDSANDQCRWSVSTEDAFALSNSNSVMDAGEPPAVLMFARAPSCSLPSAAAAAAAEGAVTAACRTPLPSVGGMPRVHSSTQPSALGSAPSAPPLALGHPTASATHPSASAFGPSGMAGAAGRASRRALVVEEHSDSNAMLPMAAAVASAALGRASAAEGASSPSPQLQQRGGLAAPGPTVTVASVELRVAAVVAIGLPAAPAADGATAPAPAAAAPSASGGPTEQATRAHLRGTHRERRLRHRIVRSSRDLLAHGSASTSTLDSSEMPRREAPPGNTSRSRSSDRDSGGRPRSGGGGWVQRRRGSLVASPRWVQRQLGRVSSPFPAAHPRQPEGASERHRNEPEGLALGEFFPDDYGADSDSSSSCGSVNQLTVTTSSGGGGMNAATWQ